MGPKVGWGGASGNQQDRTNNVNQIDAVLDMVLACGVCGAGGLRKGTMAFVSTSVWEKAVPQLSP